MPRHPPPHCVNRSFACTETPDRRVITYLAASIDDMNRIMKWTGVIAVIALAAACFIPWVVIESRQLTITGVATDGTTFGKPGYLHLIFGFIFLVLTFIPHVGAKRFNLIFTALNLGWAIRNYFMISACAGGECPEKQSGLWIILICSILMLFSSFFPDMEVPAEKD